MSTYYNITIDEPPLESTASHLSATQSHEPPPCFIPAPPQVYVPSVWVLYPTLLMYCSALHCAALPSADRCCERLLARS